MDLKQKSETDLKALVYDQLYIIEQCQNNIKILNAELQSRKPESKMPINAPKESKK